MEAGHTKNSNEAVIWVLVELATVSRALEESEGVARARYGQGLRPRSSLRHETFGWKRRSWCIDTLAGVGEGGAVIVVVLDELMEVWVVNCWQWCKGG